eukprot:jgi/Botrbrau1/14599/Bobra.242_2s0009.1
MASLDLQWAVPFLLALAITGEFLDIFKRAILMPMFRPLSSKQMMHAQSPSSSYALPAVGDNSQSLDGAQCTDALNNTEYSQIFFVSETLKASQNSHALREAQDPYKSIVGKVLQNKEVCGPINDTQAQLLWNIAGGFGIAPANYGNLLTTIRNTTLWAYSLQSVVSAAASITGQAAASAPPSKAGNIVPGDPPLAINTLWALDTLANYSIDLIVAPNADTLYAVGFLDLSGGPLLVNIPDSKGRYFVVQTLDAYSNVPIVIDSLNTPKGGRFVFALENYKGPPIPKDYEVLYFPTPLVWIVQRIFVTNNATDIAAAQTLQANTTFTPLFPDNYTLPTAQANLARDALHGVFNPSLRTDENVSVWWGLLGPASELNPPITRAEQTILDTYLVTTGVSKNASNIAGLPLATQVALNLGLAAGLQCIEWQSLNESQYHVTTSTGWSAPNAIVKLNDTAGPNKNQKLVGGYYTDLNLRNVVARLVLGANAPKTAVYYISQYAVSDPSKPVTEKTMLPLDGSKYNYTMTFPTFPNVSGFWSVSVYKDGSFLFFGDTPYNKANGTYRYNINQATPGVDFNGGKNFTLYLSATPPPEGSAVYKNWIPIGKVPDSKFASYLRLYGPDAAAQNGTYAPPALVAHKGTWGEPRTST